MKTLILGVAAVLLLCAACGAAQEGVRAQMFGRADELMKSAKNNGADFYAERTYMQGLNYYRDADKGFTRGGSLEEIRDNLTHAEDAFTRAIDLAKRAALLFSRAAAARNDADSAGASRVAPDLWNTACDTYRDAARRLEDNDADGAATSGAAAAAQFRTAEREAVKTNFLAPARMLLKQADEVNAGDNAPKTLAKAKAAAAKVDEILARDHYDADEAREAAQEAKNEALHALYLNQAIAKMKQGDQSLEDALLAGEAQLAKVGGSLGLAPRFDKGWEPPVADMLGAIRRRDAQIAAGNDSIAALAEMSRQKGTEVDNLREQVKSMEGRLGSLTENERQLQAAGKELEEKLLRKQQQEETIRQVGATFTAEEANVLRDADNIIIRLYGLSFPVGRSSIEAEYYPLLGKAQEAIKKFPGASVTIEGHTDSQGSDEANQTLSESRAKAVAEYFMANMSVALPISAHGFGESRPVASNDTPEGRAKNRRIDIVITPSWSPAAR